MWRMSRDESLQIFRRRLLRLFVEPFRLRFRYLSRLPGRERASTLSSLAWQAIKLGEWNGAARLAEAAIECDPSFSQAYIALARAYKKTGRLSRALAVLRDGSEYAPDCFVFPAAAGDIHLALRDYPAAERAYRQLV